MFQPGKETASSFKPRVFSDRESPDSVRAREYLYRTTRSLGVDALAGFGENLHESHDPEIRLYGAWAQLEAAFPGYFSLMQEDKAWVGTSDETITATTPFSRVQLDKAFASLAGIERKTTFATSLDEIHKLDPKLLDVGNRASMLMPLKPYLLRSGNKIHSRSTMREQLLAAQVAEQFAERASRVRKQLNHLLGMRDALVTKGDGNNQLPAINQAIGLISGREAELRTLGSIWHAKAIGASRFIAFPASIRLDYDFTHKEPQADIIVLDIDSEEKFGLDVVRRLFVAPNTGGEARVALENEPIAQRPHVKEAFPVYAFHADKALRLGRTSLRGTGLPPFKQFNDRESRALAQTFSGRFS